MGIMQFFKKLVGKGKADEPLIDYERLTCTVVRTENLDWQGLPIDCHAGGPISPSPGLKKHRELVSDLLERVGLRVEERIPPRGVQAVSDFGEIADIFVADASRQSTTWWRLPPEDHWLRQ